MANVLVVAEVAEGKLKKTTHSAVTFARQAAAALGGTFSILVIGAGAAGAARRRRRRLGAAKVLVAEDASLENYVAERYAPTVAEVGKGLRGRRRHRERLRQGPAPARRRPPRRRLRGRHQRASSPTAARSPTSARCSPATPTASAKITTPIQVVSVRQSAFTAAEPAGAASPVEKVAVAAPEGGRGPRRVRLASIR